MRKFAPVVLLGLVACLMTLPALADTPAATMDNTTGDALANGPFTLGWQFTVSQTITVTGLGVFDDSLDGLGESHDVGIWDSAGNLMGSSTVASGTTDPLVNQFRYSSVSFTLAPGTYNIGAVWLDGVDGMLFQGGPINFATASGITFDLNAYVAGGTLSDPINNVDNEPAFFGPNFLFTGSTTTPEPGTLVLLGSGLLGAVGVLRRKINL